MPDIKKVFIANRGEICGRIAATAKRMGIETVAITDRQHPPAFLQHLITEFITVEDETTAIYLDAERIINYAKQTKCDAIHPGFGFLSESDTFAALVEKSSLIWIGPTPKAISIMANKATARELAIESKVPCVKGMQDFEVPEDASGDFSTLENFAEEAGYPLLIKAALGGGGKGMRLVRQKSELKDAALRARSEAINSFGNGALIIERYVEAPRHIEVQILADSHGNAYAIGDRDCSVQRRHQKILEEAPAPEISDKTRLALHECAVSLAKKVGYRSAGTVEFLLDWSKGKMTEDQEFFFLEMNTRLQVEHPVTEEVFGMDLVEWQFRVAQGETLPKNFANLKPSRHSIEARFYAENVDGDFFPSPGPVYNFTPYQDLGIRWEVGLDTIDEITPKFDPMVAKVIATGETREIAIEKLANALKRTIFVGPVNNLEFLMDICENSVFAKEPVDTHFIEKHFDKLIKIRDQKREEYSSTADKVISALENGNGNLLQTSNTQVENNIKSITHSAFSKSNKNSSTGAKTDITVSKMNQVFDAFNPQLDSSFGLGLVKNEQNKNVPFHFASIKSQNLKKFAVVIDGRTYQKEVTKKSWEGSTSSSNNTHDITAPVPGKVIKILVNPGESIEEGQTAFVLESMKMEFEVKAPKSGTIESIKIEESSQVTTGQQLASWEEASE